MTDWTLEAKRDWLARLCGWYYDEEFTGWFNGDFESEIFSIDHPMANSDLLSAGCDPLMRAAGHMWNVWPNAADGGLEWVWWDVVVPMSGFPADTLNAALVAMFWDALYTEEATGE